MKAKIYGKTIEIPDERMKAGDRLSGGHRRGAGDVGAAHERRESGTNTSLVKSGGRTTSPTNDMIEIPDERMGKERGGVDRHAPNRDRTPGRTPIVAIEERLGKPDCQGQAPSPLPGWPKPSDKWNYLFAQHLELRKHGGEIKHWWYEPWSMWLPGGVRFKPDFLIQYPDGLERPLHVVEVKGGWSRNRRDGITRYKIAAALFPCFQWSMMKLVRHGWEEYGA